MHCVAEGGLAAFLGLAAVAMLVLLLWVASPYPHGGPGDALRIAAGLWLLAHGAELVRTEALGGGPAPVGLTPLFLTVLPAVLLFRAGRAARSAHAVPAAVSWRIVLLLSVGYLLVAGLVCWYVLEGTLRVDPASAALRLPLATVVPVCVGVWAAQGWPQPPPSLCPLPNGLPWPRVFTALRAAVAALATLCVGGALLVVVGIVLHWGVAADTFGQLTDAWSGRVAVLLLCLALVPNAALWAASYGLGTGFTLGSGSVVGPLAASGYPQLPHFPLLAAVPAEGSGDSVVMGAVAVVPVSAGVLAGWFTARGCLPVRGSEHGSAGALGTTGTVLLAALGCGVGMAVLSSYAGGALGTGELAGLGPNWWLSGAVSSAWVALFALPTALWVRWWRLREPRPLLALAIGLRRFVTRTTEVVRLAVRWPRRRQDVRPESDWHATGSRHSRWAALRRASGGLTADLSDAGQAATDQRSQRDQRDARGPGEGRSDVRGVPTALPVKPVRAEEFAMPTPSVRPRPPVGDPDTLPETAPETARRSGEQRDLPAPAELSHLEHHDERVPHAVTETTEAAHPVGDQAVRPGRGD